MEAAAFVLYLQTALRPDLMSTGQPEGAACVHLETQRLVLLAMSGARPAGSETSDLYQLYKRGKRVSLQQALPFCLES